jgi:hypothetical protein
MTGEMPVANSIDQNGALGRLSQMAAALERGFTKGGAEGVHNALIAGFRDVPSVSGALKRSLLRKGDRAHVWIVEPLLLRYGSTLPYAYRAAPHNKTDPVRVAQAVADALFAPLRPGT